MLNSDIMCDLFGSNSSFSDNDDNGVSINKNESLNGSHEIEIPSSIVNEPRYAKFGHSKLVPMLSRACKICWENWFKG